MINVTRRWSNPIVWVGDKEQAFIRDILGHWAACAQHDDTQSINIEGMRAQNFEYPHGMLSALASQAAYLLAGEQGHWNYFDAVQRAHLADSRNIGDMDTLLDIAVAQGFDGEAFLSAMDSDIAQQRVLADRAEAVRLGIQSIPTLDDEIGRLNLITPRFSGGHLVPSGWQQSL